MQNSPEPNDLPDISPLSSAASDDPATSPLSQRVLSPLQDEPEAMQTAEVLVGGLLASLSSAVTEDVLHRQEETVHFLEQSALMLKTSSLYSVNEREDHEADLEAHIAQLSVLREQLETTFTRVRRLKKYLIEKHPEEYKAAVAQQ